VFACVAALRALSTWSQSDFPAFSEEQWEIGLTPHPDPVHVHGRARPMNAELRKRDMRLFIKASHTEKERARQGGVRKARRDQKDPFERRPYI